MDRNLQRVEVVNGGYGVVDSNKVLRNTYWLLALSMLPTIAGAWIGVQTGVFAHMSPMMSLLVFFGGAFGLMYGVQRFKDSSVGVFMLLGFTFFMGLMLSRLLGAVLGGYSNGSSLIMTAFGGTAGVFFGMATLATVVKRDLSGLTRFLMVGAMIAIVASVINMFVQSSAAMLAISTAVMVIFSIFVMVDIKRVIDGGERNYVMATLSIYLDLYNVFQSLLILLTSLTGNRR
jgi:modulator of FtsH protease